MAITHRSHFDGFALVIDDTISGGRVLKIDNPNGKYFGKLLVYGTDIISLGNLTWTLEGLDAGKTKITGLGNFTSSNGDVYLAESEVTDLGNFTSAEGDVNISLTHVSNLDLLTFVGGNLNLRHCYDLKRWSKDLIVRGTITLADGTETDVEGAKKWFLENFLDQNQHLLETTAVGAGVVPLQPTRARAQFRTGTFNPAANDDIALSRTVGVHEHNRSFAPTADI